MFLEFIDAYAHCGLSKYKPLPELENAMNHAGVDRAVLVQHLGEFDNAYIGSIVADNPEKFAGVCLVDHTSGDAVNALRQWAGTWHFRGVRFLLESLESNKPLWQSAVDLGLNMIVYAPDGIVGRLSLLMDFMEKNPSAVVVLSHLGVPSLQADPGLKRHCQIFKLSRYSHAHYQVSGMHMFCPYPYKQLWPIIEQAMESFGADRVLWGGNYPVVGSDEDYVREVEQVRSGGLPISKDTLHKVTVETALKLWFS